MQAVMDLMERPEQTVVGPVQQRAAGSEGKKAIDSKKTTEESKFRALLERMVEKPKAEKSDRPVVTDDLWAQLVLLFPQLSTASGSGEGVVHTGTGEELGAVDQVSDELLARLVELTAENTTTAGDESVAVDASTLNGGVEIIPDLEQMFTAMPTGNDPMTEVTGISESEGALAAETLKGTALQESEETKELPLPDQALTGKAETDFPVEGTGTLSHQSGLTGEHGSGLAGFETDQQMEAEATPVSHQSTTDQDSQVTVDSASAEAENAFQLTSEHSGESKFVKTEFETFFNSAAVNPVPQEAEVPPALTETAKTSPVISKEEFAAQIISGAKLMVNNGVTKIQIQLEPAELGKLELSLVIERDLVAARFVTETQGVQALIESNLTQLRSSLEEAGLNVDLLQVGVQTGTDQQNQTASGNEQYKRNAGWVAPFTGMYGVEEQVFTDEAWHGMVNFRV